MGTAFSSGSDAHPPRGAAEAGEEPELTITGLGTEWPSQIVTSDDFRQYLLRHYPADAAWVQTLLKINARSGIASRALIGFNNNPHWYDPRNQPTPPTAEQVSSEFHCHGVPLAARAVRAALTDSHLPASAITHTVAVTVTNAGAPGYDQAVFRDVGISPGAERVLLSGIGCAGGLAALRVGSSLARAATLQRKPARVLVLACEVCSIHLAAELHATAKKVGLGGGEDISIGPALFSDGAAALVLCNALALTGEMPRRFAVVDYRTGITPETHEAMSYRTTEYGFQLTLAREVPALAVASLRGLFGELMQANGMASVGPGKLEWAVHPGGLTILRGAQLALGLSDEAIRASSEVYESRGNSSSVAVLAVLDRLRRWEGRSLRKEVVAVSFGPGLTTEMVLLRRLV
ncbi:thiolase-like protein [Aspergillus aculeatinus CBS 121060]|uniref:Thiolase-like protein n=1 Tax=Aspergillus aculeatinus CBS 121060 TaxID=1448322 RepID=A0ACD1H5P1_9EURO|nr:thiolase-like protein [Aspergillus aculeatinus CBS 121060]RAH68722.1 thiolase-like protein [Aspergillus aculeatinus CBS 121060]